VTYLSLRGGLVQYTCKGRHDDGHEFVWELSREQARTGGGDRAADGVTDELLEPLLACVRPDDPFLEYGIIEYRLAQARSDLFVAHVRERGHVMLAASRVTASNSRFIPALVRLASYGQLVKKVGRATGAWRYNHTITYWARPDTPASSTLTWEAYCAQIGRDPYWTDEDRAAVS
jgi:hypothetical protein